MARSGACIVLPALIVALILGACKDSTGPREPGIRFVSGAGGTSTFGSRQTLIVEVRGEDGRIAPGAEVRFDAINSDPPAAFSQRPIFVAKIGATFFNISALDTTDANGRAEMRVAFGSRAGPAGVAVTVAALSFTDTATYTVAAR